MLCLVPSCSALAHGSAAFEKNVGFDVSEARIEEIIQTLESVFPQLLGGPPHVIYGGLPESILIVPCVTECADCVCALVNDASQSQRLFV